MPAVTLADVHDVHVQISEVYHIDCMYYVTWITSLLTQQVTVRSRFLVSDSQRHLQIIAMRTSIYKCMLNSIYHVYTDP